MLDGIAQQIFKLAGEGYTKDEIYTMLDGDIDTDTIEAIVDASKAAVSKGLISAPLDITEQPTSVSAEQIYKNAHARAAQRLVTIAITERENTSAAVRALIYINEEATNRNSERVKNSGVGGFLQNVGTVLNSIQKAREAARSALELPRDKVIELQ